MVQEDRTCRRATKPVQHDCGVCALEQLLRPTRLESVLHKEATTLQARQILPQKREKALAQEQRPRTAKNK